MVSYVINRALSYTTFLQFSYLKHLNTTNSYTTNFKFLGMGARMTHYPTCYAMNNDINIIYVNL